MSLMLRLCSSAKGIVGARSESHEGDVEMVWKEPCRRAFEMVSIASIMEFYMYLLFLWVWKVCAW